MYITFNFLITLYKPYKAQGGGGGGTMPQICLPLLEFSSKFGDFS